MIYYSEINVRRMPPRLRVRTNRNGESYRSPTPNRPEEDPFIMSPGERLEKSRQEQRLEEQKKAIERAKRMALQHKNKNNNNTVNHLQTNAPNFKNKLRNMNNPTYLLSDALNNKNGKIRHVYPRDYLNKAFKNKTIHRGIHTGVPTDPSMMRNYRGVNTINKRQHEIYQRSKEIMIQVYGREGYFNTNLQTLHATNKLKPHHRDFTLMVQNYTQTFKKFIYDFLHVPKYIRVPDWYTLSATEIKKIKDIMDVYVTKLDEFATRPYTRHVFINKIVQILYKTNYNGGPQIRQIINRHKEFFNQFKNLLNL